MGEQIDRDRQATPSVFVHGSGAVALLPFPASYAVLDSAGRAVSTGDAPSGEVELGPLPVGRYVVTCRGGDATWQSALAVVPEPSAAPERRLSVNVHTAVTAPDELAVVRLGGFGAVRSSVSWDQVEREGRIAYPRRYIDFAEATAANGLALLLIACYRHADHDHGEAIRSAGAIDAFARYAADQVVRLPQATAIEIYNEYDWWGTSTPGGPVEDFVRLAEATAAAVRRSRPGITVIGGSTSAPKGEPAWDWLEQAAILGVLDHLDGLSAHIYCPHSPPEGRGDVRGVAALLADMHAIVERHGGGWPLPIWVTETGWGTAVGTDPATADADQAAWLVRNAVIALSAGVEQVCWYMFSDVREEVVGESYGWDFGLLRYDAPVPGGGPLPERLVPKPAFVAHAVMASLLAGAEPRGGVGITGAAACYRFEGSSGDVMVAWTTDDQSREAHLPVHAVAAVSSDGSRAPTEHDGPATRVRIGPDPIYVLTGEVPSWLL